MAITVYGWRKPTISASLVEGGSLLANTKYYICGCLKFTPYVYNSVGSVISDVIEITTTSTARSIQLSHKTYRDITAFASGGTGVTTVTCARHCLRSGDQIKIDSGSYTGTWTVTKVDANSFTIATAYVDNVPVQCYTDSAYYNKPSETLTYYSEYIGVTYWIGTFHPIPDGVTFAIHSYWTSTPYQNNNLTNPTTVTAQPGGVNYNCGGCFKVRRINNGLFSGVAEYGTIVVYLSAAHTPQEVYNAVIAAGFSYNCVWSDSPFYTFVMIGTIVCYTASASLNLNYYNVSLIVGELYHTLSNTLISLNYAMLNTFPISYQSYMRLTGNGMIYFNNNTVVSSSGYFFGSDIVSQSSQYIANGSVGCDLYNQILFNYGDNANHYYGIVQNKILRPTSPSGNTQVAYCSIKYVNCTLFSSYFNMYSGAYGTQPDIYMAENCYVTQAGLIGGSGNLWHYRFYAYPAGLSYQNIVKFLNINTDDTSNVKKCINNSVITIDADFYRRLKLYIKDQSGTNISSASISIVDGSGNSYSGTTDVNGYAYIDCLEQRTRFVAKAAATTHNPAYDTHYTNFTITITKTGFQTQIIRLSQLYITGMYDTIINLSLIGNPYPKSKIVNAIA